ncbi:MAG TPA: beta-ketoacyl-[acyl-carrier-protein] synthase family protein [Tepidisphaeraceae bacterium]|jgi:3-oxoacyl-(acyl-carrier-protein) synthase
MERSCVWIAGIGAVSGAGSDIAATLESFRGGRRNPSTTLPFECSIDCPTFQVSAELPEIPSELNQSRSLRLAMKAVGEAMAEAGISAFDSGVRVGVCIGTTVASQLNSIPFYDAYRREGNPPLDAVYEYLRANLGQAVAELLGVTGPRMTVVNACSSGTDAIGIATNWIRAGLCDVAIAGGADELNRVAMAGFWSLGVMSSRPCAPFDRDRDGLNLGEGAGIVIVESESHAKKRGKHPDVQIAGFGSACDGHHLTAPHPEGRGLDAAIRTALSQAGITPDQIAFINVHGTATMENDRAEGKVLDRIFGSAVPLAATKGYTGHTLGAAGGLEAVFTVMGLRNGWIPASAGFQNRAEDIAVSPALNQTTMNGTWALSTSLAFGGNNAALLIRRITRDSQNPMNSERPSLLSPATILGIGVVTPAGRNLREIELKLASPPSVPGEILRVSDDSLSDPAIGSRMRRADRFSRMAAVAALDCWASVKGLANIPRERIGLIISTGFGPHCRGFRFLDGILDCGDASALPTDFSHSVHGAAAAYITELLELRGPSLTTTDFEIGFEQAVLLAQCWLDQGVCDRVLVGAVEEIGEVLVHCASRMVNGDEALTLGEGAVFLMLGPGDGNGLTRIEAAPLPAEMDLMMLDIPAIPTSATECPIGRARHTTTFLPYFGHSPSCSAFQLLGGYLSLIAGRPLGRLLGGRDDGRGDGLGNRTAVDKVATCKPSCDPRVTSLLLTRA